MLHPSYVELMDAVNASSEDGEKIVASRYSIVMASAKRARQIVSGDVSEVGSENDKPLSRAVEELYENKVQILPNGSVDEE